MNERYNFLGVNISVINIEEAIKKIVSYPFTSPGYICFPDASVVNEASKDAFLASVLNNAWITMPDGKPSQLAARLLGHKEVSTVSGFHLCSRLLETELTHYFYGGDEQMLVKLRNNLSAQYPRASVLGFKAPPMVKKEAIRNDRTIQKDIAEINALKPDLVWIGVSSPKQDYLMHYFHRSLDKSLMLGVGGVFLYLADSSLKSPEFIKKIGLRWAYRLLKEPVRLWPKYYGTFTFLLRHMGYFVRSFLKGRSGGKGY